MDTLRHTRDNKRREPGTKGRREEAFGKANLAGTLAYPSSLQNWKKTIIESTKMALPSYANPNQIVTTGIEEYTNVL